MISKVLQDWITHTDSCWQCRMARSESRMCDIGRKMSPAVEEDIRESMWQEMREQDNNKKKDKDPMNELIQKLQEAKDAVRWLLDHENSSVAFHGLAYWAGEVERLRAEIKKSL